MVFNYLTAHAEIDDYNPLLVAPLTMAESFLRLIRRKQGRAQAGRPAHIVAKMERASAVPAPLRCPWRPCTGFVGSRPVGIRKGSQQGKQRVPSGCGESRVSWPLDLFHGGDVDHQLHGLGRAVWGPRVDGRQMYCILLLVNCVERNESRIEYRHGQPWEESSRSYWPTSRCDGCKPSAPTNWSMPWASRPTGAGTPQPSGPPQPDRSGSPRPVSCPATVAAGRAVEPE